MAVKAKVMTTFGEERQVYIRLNSIEASNHGQPAHALFRGFLSKEAFETKAHYVWECEIAFKADVAAPLWQQAYAALKSRDDMGTMEDA